MSRVVSYPSILGCAGCAPQVFRPYEVASEAVSGCSRSFSI